MTLEDVEKYPAFQHIGSKILMIGPQGLMVLAIAGSLITFG